MTHELEYVDIESYWDLICYYLEEGSDIRKQLHEDFSRYVTQRWGDTVTFESHQLPRDLETCLGLFTDDPPAFWDLVKHGACHWLVNYQLMLAQAIMPQYEWCILTSDKHSTVWNKENLIWDANFLALGQDAQKAFDLANDEVLPNGKHLDSSSF